MPRSLRPSGTPKALQTRSARSGEIEGPNSLSLSASKRLRFFLNWRKREAYNMGSTRDQHAPKLLDPPGFRALGNGSGRCSDRGQRPGSLNVNLRRPAARVYVFLKRGAGASSYEAFCPVPGRCMRHVKRRLISSLGLPCGVRAPG